MACRNTIRYCTYTLYVCVQRICTCLKPPKQHPWVHQSRPLRLKFSQKNVAFCHSNDEPYIHHHHKCTYTYIKIRWILYPSPNLYRTWNQSMYSSVYTCNTIHATPSSVQSYSHTHTYTFIYIHFTYILCIQLFIIHIRL